MLKIRSISEFKKAYKLPIPVYDHFDYYIDLLRQSPEFSKLDQWLEAFQQFELQLPLGEDAKSARIGWGTKLIGEIKERPAYTRMNATPIEKGLPRQKMAPYHDRKILISVDLVKANYSMLRTFDEALPLTWRGFCERYNVPEALIQSKSFRQIIFGNLNPKRIQQLQLQTIHKIMLFARGSKTWLRISNETFDDASLIFVSPDEFIVTTGNDSLTLPRKLRGMLKRVEKWNSNPKNPQARVTYFRLDHLDGCYRKEIGSIKTHYELTGEDTLIATHKSLYGVPGDRFYMNFKRHILGGELEPRDLQFMNEKHLAQWVLEKNNNDW